MGLDFGVMDGWVSEWVRMNDVLFFLPLRKNLLCVGFVWCWTTARKHRSSTLYRTRCRNEFCCAITATVSPQASKLFRCLSIHFHPSLFSQDLVPFDSLTNNHCSITVSSFPTKQSQSQSHFIPQVAIPTRKCPLQQLREQGRWACTGNSSGALPKCQRPIDRITSFIKRGRNTEPIEPFPIQKKLNFWFGWLIRIWILSWSRLSIWPSCSMKIVKTPICSGSEEVKNAEILQFWLWSWIDNDLIEMREANQIMDPDPSMMYIIFYENKKQHFTKRFHSNTSTPDLNILELTISIEIIAIDRRGNLHLRS